MEVGEVGFVIFVINGYGSDPILGTHDKKETS